MRSARLFLLASSLIAAIGVTAAQERAPRIPGIDPAGMDLSVRPQDDFFRYVNGRWVDNTPIPARSVHLRHVCHPSRTQPRRRCAASSKPKARAQAAPGSNSQKVGDLYKSFMDEARIEALGITPLNGELAQIAKITDSRDLPAAFAHAAQIGVRLPFSVNVGADQRNSEQYAVQISQSGLGMPDRDYYLRNDEKFAATRKAYTTYIAQAVRARQPARSRGRRRAHRRARDQAGASSNGIARATAIATRPTTRWASRRCRRRRRTSTGKPICRRCRRAPRTRQ